MKPDPRANTEFTICDPACGTGGFLVCSYEWLMKQTKGGALPRDLAKRIKSGTYFGQELVARPRRLTLMNLYLHGLEPHIKFGDSIYESPDGRRFDVVMTLLEQARQESVNQAAAVKTKTLGTHFRNLKESRIASDRIVFTGIRVNQPCCAIVCLIHPSTNVPQ